MAKTSKPSRKQRAASASEADKGQRVRTQRETAAVMSTERMGEVRRRATQKLHADMDPKTGRPRR